ncbi:MAG: 2,3-diphosphoglycerate-dependent phosphoglycerate mutase [Flavobacteriales bacterium]|nr:2,3-diphosphoglycerate-dependent phosphoglycerate mutase [Flavobacteriales bacterium]
MSKLVIVRHGQSEWNAQNRFTGWVDVELAPKGIEEARKAGEKLKGYRFDKGYTSALKRAQNTLVNILEVTGQTDLPVVKDQALNERMYGDLQGMNKDEMRAQFGDAQVHIWRRSFDVPPPGGESLKDTAARVLPYFEKVIVPELKAGKDIIIAAHGNSLRALIMFLEKLTPDEILKTEVPTGEPKLYELDADLKVLRAEYL